jgi:methylase of polypeptide subunit release factors
VVADRPRIALLGCGDGRTLVALALVLPEATIAGFDPDPVAVAISLRTAMEGGVADRVTVERTAVLLGGGYDLVVARTVRQAGRGRGRR